VKIKKTKVQSILLLLTLMVTFSFCTYAQYGGGKTYTVKTVVIDAGHGGHDHGTSGTRFKEKDVALDIALKVGKMIENQVPEVKVLYTRKSDKFISLKERAQFANRNNADLFISIHCNGGSTRASGTETFVLGLHRNEDNLKVAMRENNSILLEDDYNQHYGNFQPNSPEAYIIFNMHQSSHLSQSLDLASMVEEEFKDVANRRSRGVKQAGFLVLRETAMPSVLVETGFLTNKTEEGYLSSRNGKEKLATSIFSAFKSYKDKLDKEAARIRAKKIQEQKEAAEAEAKRIEEEKRKTESAWAWPPLRRNHQKGEYYFIQLLVSNSYDKGPETFKGMDNVVMDYIKRADSWKYMIGPYKTREEAQKAQLEAREKGFRDAFVLRYLDGKRAK